MINDLALLRVRDNPDTRASTAANGFVRNLHVKKRVLQLVGSFHQGGTERQALSMIRALRDRDEFDVFVATMNAEGSLHGGFASLGLPEIPEYKITSFYRPDFVSQVRRFARDLVTKRIDIIHTTDFYTNVFGMAAASLARVPLKIASKRETSGVRSRGQEMVERIAFGRADRITANSGSVRKFLVGQGIAPAKISVIYNGIDVGRFGSHERERNVVCRELGLPFAGGRRYITAVANLRHAVKNIPMLLRAATVVTQRFPDVDFVIAGEGELRTDLFQMAADLGIQDRVHFIGRCIDVPGLLSISYACVLTSTAEGFSNSILEYMAAGRPVVATNVGGAAEAIADGECGYLVRSDDHIALADRLGELLLNQDRSAQMGSRGRQIVTERFSLDSSLGKTLELYRG